ncbi:MAG TPA: hypothetical protein VFT29_06600 [Gemmatimonadaceae bacterium]|nr:hypothetical protein [Gemmatimonadaceae bacterium]
MPVTADDPDDPTGLEIMFLRVPPRMKQRVEAIAARNGNSLSATARALLAAGLRSEERQAGTSAVSPRRRA